MYNHNNAIAKEKTVRNIAGAAQFLISMWIVTEVHIKLIVRM